MFVKDIKMTEKHIKYMIKCGI